MQYHFKLTTFPSLHGWSIYMGPPIVFSLIGGEISNIDIHIIRKKPYITGEQEHVFALQEMLVS